MRNLEQVAGQFRERFGGDPQTVAQAPGRVTLIGGHTDYNGGMVVAAPLSLGITVAIGRSDGDITRIVSDQELSVVKIPAGHLPTDSSANWALYIVGVLRELGGHEGGLNVFVSSDLPMRRGMASSGALTAASALAASGWLNRRPQLVDLALICQRVEEKYVGVRCGLLDPYTALHSRYGRPMVIDCSTNTHDELVLPPEIAVVVCDSGTDRQLTKSMYNIRRQECQQVVAASGKASLRDVTLDELQNIRDRFPLQTRRAEHVIREIERVRQFCSALAARDYARIKNVMSESHQSCRDLFECSHPVLNALVEKALAHPACVGARLTGAGWGGATVSLVYRDQLKNFCEFVGESYRPTIC